MAHKVLLVDDHAIVRQGIRSLLSEESDLEIVGDACDGLEAVKMVEEFDPDIVIMDISMPNLNGIEAARRIKEFASKSRVIMLSAYQNQRFVSEAVKAGAKGYVCKDCLFDELYQAIKVVVSGKSYISPTIAALLMEDYLQENKISSDQGWNALTPREKEVLQLLAEGKNSKEIGCMLDVSSKTVDAARRSIMEKLDKHSLADLTKFAIKKGLTTLDF